MNTVFRKGIFFAVSLLLFGLMSVLPASEVTLLDTHSNWRMFSVIKPPVIQSAAENKPVVLKIKWADSPSAKVPADWNKSGMDDSGWLRGPVTLAPNVSMLDRLYLRGVFTVTDPEASGDLTLTAQYRGGIIIYLNGEEIGRNNIAKDKRNDPKAQIFAENYPEEAFVADNGIWLGPPGAKLSGNKAANNSESIRRTGLWLREAAIKIPSGTLKKGANVLCIEVVRAPYGKAFSKVDTSKPNGGAYEFLWATCRMIKLELTAASEKGVVATPGRPKGLQVWNADILAGDYDRDFGNPAEPLKPIKITGPRNGIFSGKVLVGSTSSIKGLSASAGELKGVASIISADALRIRYGVPWGQEIITNQTYHAQPNPYLAATTFMGSLSNKPLPEYSPGKAAGKSPAGAVAPVWLTVKIPKEASPGIYFGDLTISTAGEKDIIVPVELKVLSFSLPDAQDYRTWVDLIQSPDTLVEEYKVPLWSDKHLEMIAESFRLMSAAGTRTVYIPAIAHTNLGNEESMIRWINKGKNKYDWDFSIMEKYLDLAQKNLGTPKIVVLQVWEVYFRSTMQKRFEDFAALGYPQVTFVDPATGKTEFGKLPALSDSASKAIWKELIFQVQARLKKRGLEKALMLGMFCDAIPPVEDVKFFFDIVPKVPWVQQGHGLFTKLQSIADVGYNATVWGGFRFGDGCKQTNQVGEPVTESLKGWNNPRLDAVFERNVNLDTFPATRWYFFPETGITSELRGIGRIGADYWKAVKDKNGRRVNYVHDRYREGCWGGTSIALNLCNPILAPGAEGPEATNRLIAMIEGVEACEARIYLEKALLDSGSKARMGSDLCKRSQALLDERLYDMWKTLSNMEISTAFGGFNMWRWGPGVAGHNYFLGSGWQNQAEKLFVLAGEAEQKIGKKK